MSQDNETKKYLATKVFRQSEDKNSRYNREITALTLLKGKQGILDVIHTGREHGFDYIIVELLSRDLEYYLNSMKKFSLQCTISIGISVLNILESIHSSGLVHRDICPKNIIPGRGEKQQQIYIVGFGRSKFFRQQDGTHIAQNEGKIFQQSLVFASIACHNNQEQSRKDDLESLLYVLVYFLKGDLPWIKKAQKNDQNGVGQMKRKITSVDLCEGIPIEFQRFYDYVRKLSFKSAPDYKYLQTLINRVIETHKLDHQFIFDWGEAFQNSNIMVRCLKTEKNEVSSNNYNSNNNSQAISSEIRSSYIEQQLEMQKKSDLNGSFLLINMQGRNNQQLATLSSNGSQNNKFNKKQLSLSSSPRLGKGNQIVLLGEIRTQVDNFNLGPIPEEGAEISRMYQQLKPIDIKHLKSRKYQSSSEEKLR